MAWRDPGAECATAPPAAAGSLTRRGDHSTRRPHTGCMHGRCLFSLARVLAPSGAHQSTELIDRAFRPRLAPPPPHASALPRPPAPPLARPVPRTATRIRPRPSITDTGAQTTLDEIGRSAEGIGDGGGLECSSVRHCTVCGAWRQTRSASTSPALLRSGVAPVPAIGSRPYVAPQQICASAAVSYSYLRESAAPNKLGVRRPVLHSAPHMWRRRLNGPS